MSTTLNGHGEKLTDEMRAQLNQREVIPHGEEIKVGRDEPEDDEVDHPNHYTSHPSGVECITVTEHMTFNIGNAVKYAWRAGLKSDDPVTDLRKAEWYIRREIQRLSEAGDET